MHDLLIQINIGIITYIDYRQKSKQDIKDKNMSEEQFVTTTSDNVALHLADVRDAAARIKPFIHYTPVLTSRTLDQLVEAQVFLKAECYQRAGAFKIRGALNKVLQLSAEERVRGLFAWSSGNHAQAVSLAAPQSPRASTRSVGFMVLNR